MVVGFNNFHNKPYNIKQLINLKCPWPTQKYTVDYHRCYILTNKVVDFNNLLSVFNPHSLFSFVIGTD